MCSAVAPLRETGKLRNLEILRAREWLGAARFCAGKGVGDAVSETGPEIGNLAAGSGEPGRGPARGGRSRVPEGWGCRISRKRTLVKRPVDGKFRHIAVIRISAQQTKTQRLICDNICRL
jgi:hypothetical protein